jgi:hypothetical protein
MVAVNCDELKNTVERFWPLRRTTEFTLKPLPSTVREKLGPPAATVGGLIEVTI